MVLNLIPSTSPAPPEDDAPSGEDVTNIRPSVLVVSAELKESFNRLRTDQKNLDTLKGKAQKDYKNLPAFCEALMIWQNDLQIFAQRFPEAETEHEILKDFLQGFIDTLNEIFRLQQRDAIIKAVLWTAGSTAALAAAPAALGAVGFAAKGVRAGSLAAKTQSFVYGARTCGMFSRLQSAGVLGLATTTKLGIQGTGLVGAATQVFTQRGGESFPKTILNVDLACKYLEWMSDPMLLKPFVPIQHATKEGMETHIFLVGMRTSER